MLATSRRSPPQTGPPWARSRSRKYQRIPPLAQALYFPRGHPPLAIYRPQHLAGALVVIRIDPGDRTGIEVEVREVASLDHRRIELRKPLPNLIVSAAVDRPRRSNRPNTRDARAAQKSAQSASR